MSGVKKTQFKAIAKLEFATRKILPRTAEGNKTPSQNKFQTQKDASLDRFLELEGYSDGYEDRLIRHFFNNKKNGFFLDVGCAYPIIYNTTYALETQLGWKGLSIDALTSYERDWAHQRPESTFLSALIGSEIKDDVEFFKNNSPIISSKSLFQDQWANGKGYTRISLSQTTIDAVLEQHKITSVDFVNLDVESAELEALNGFDIKKYLPSLVCVELGWNKKIRHGIRAYFEKNGYEMISAYRQFDEVNRYFKIKQNEAIVA